jgi:hypothetical protein
MMESDVVLEGPVWKRTAISDYVIQRQTTLYRDKFVTSHGHDLKSWLLEPSAHIRPASKQSIERKKRRKRPAGMFYPKQLVSSKGEPIELVGEGICLVKHITRPFKCQRQLLRKLCYRLSPTAEAHFKANCLLVEKLTSSW